MSGPTKRCFNCDDSFQNFRKLTEDERDHVASVVEPEDADSYWRCTHDGCLRVQSYFNYKDGFDLPKSLR